MGSDASWSMTSFTNASLMTNDAVPRVHTKAPTAFGYLATYDCRMGGGRARGGRTTHSCAAAAVDGAEREAGRARVGHAAACTRGRSAAACAWEARAAHDKMPRLAPRHGPSFAAREHALQEHSPYAV